MSYCSVGSFFQKSVAKLNLKGQACRADSSDWQDVNCSIFLFLFQQRLTTAICVAVRLQNRLNPQASSLGELRFCNRILVKFASRDDTRRLRFNL